LDTTKDGKKEEQLEKGGDTNESEEAEEELEHDVEGEGGFDKESEGERDIKGLEREADGCCGGQGPADSCAPVAVLWKEAVVVQATVPATTNINKINK
jgi:hypothetical protein